MISRVNFKNVFIMILKKQILFNFKETFIIREINLMLLFNVYNSFKESDFIDFYILNNRSNLFVKPQILILTCRIKEI